MALDNKALDTFEIITQTFDQVESDLERANARGEMDEREYAMSLVGLLYQRIQSLCDEVPGFREELDRFLDEDDL